MGRNRSFEEAVVVRQAAAASTRRSPASATCSWPACGQPSAPEQEETTDLVLVALLELAPRDSEVREVLTHHLAERGIAPLDLGARLVERAGVTLGKES